MKDITRTPAGQKAIAEAMARDVKEDPEIKEIFKKAYGGDYESFALHAKKEYKAVETPEGKIEAGIWWNF